MSHLKQTPKVTVWKYVCSCFLPILNHGGFPPRYAQLARKVSAAALEGLVTSVCLGTEGFMERTGKVLMARVFM